VIEIYWAGDTAVYNMIMHTHRAVGTHIIEKVQGDQALKEALMQENRTLKNALQLGCIESGRQGFREASARLVDLKMYKMFMNTLAKKCDRIKEHRITKGEDAPKPDFARMI
jgi:hypothetical protein